MFTRGTGLLLKGAAAYFLQAAPGSNSPAESQPRLGSTAIARQLQASSKQG